MNKILPIILVVVLSGCATDDYGGAKPPFVPGSVKGGKFLGLTPPDRYCPGNVKIRSKNPRVVIIEEINCIVCRDKHMDMGAAQCLADRACKSNERYAVHRSDNLNDGIVTFQCIE